MRVTAMNRSLTSGLKTRLAEVILSAKPQNNCVLFLESFFFHVTDGSLLCYGHVARLSWTAGIIRGMFVQRVSKVSSTL